MWSWFFSICLYWAIPNGLTKMLPAIALALETSDYWICNSMLMASLGDLLLEVFDNPVPGIIMFAGVHINLIYYLDAFTYIHYYTMIPFGIISTFVAMQFKYYLNVCIWSYAALLSVLLSSSITLGNNLFLISVTLFIISDLFVAAELLNIRNIPPVGVYIYWISLAMLNQAF